MSFEAMAWASKQKTGSSGAKLVLLLLADHANGHTGQCTPKIKRIAEVCEMGESTVKTHIQKLAGLGLIEIIPRFAEGVQIANQYRLNLDGVGQNLAGGGSESGGGVGQNLATNNQEDKPVKEPVKASPAQVPNDPNLAEPKKRTSKTFAKWEEQIKAEGGKLISDTDPIFDYAEDAGIPADFLRLAWIEFRDRYRNEAKRYIDWRATFRKSVRECWFKLWWFDGQQYALTSKGQQAMQALKARESRQ